MIMAAGAGARSGDDDPLGPPITLLGIIIDIVLLPTVVLVVLWLLLLLLRVLTRTTLSQACGSSFANSSCVSVIIVSSDRERERERVRPKGQPKDKHITSCVKDIHQQ
jgi:hypothetical protein